MKKDDVVSKQIEILSEFLANTDFKDLPKEVVERAKLTIADMVGVIINGSIEPEMQKLYKQLPQGEGAVLLKEDFPVTDICTASFANTTAACFVELDELSSTGGHSAVHVFPPTLALSQMLNKSGADLITAFVLGYEIQDRIHTASKLRDGVYPHGNSGHVGATVAVGKLLGWDAEKFRQGINCAAALPLGTSYTPTFYGSTIVTVFASLSGQIAFTVKDLVESGFKGYDGALGDTFGYILGKEFNPLKLTDKLGIEYSIVNNNFKFHSSCGVVHPALEAAADALGFEIQHDEYPPYKNGMMLKSDDIKSIKIIQSTEKARRVMTYPQNKLSAKFSLPYSLAAFIVTGSAGIDSYSESVLNNSEVKSIEKLVQFEMDPSYNQTFWGSHVIIELSNGQVLKGYSNNIYGHNDNPANMLDLFNKFCSLTKMVFNEIKQKEIWNSILHLEEIDKLNDFIIN